MKNTKEKSSSARLGIRLLLLFFFVFANSVFATAQNRKVTGNVSDASGEPIIGANAIVKGTTLGTITDIDGNFSLDVSANAKVIEISFIGYETQSVTIPANNQMKVVLKESSLVLDEVVAIGYGVQKKGSLTGSVSKVNSEKLGGRPIADVASALQGQMSGVEIRTTSGEPGSGIQIRVRGAASINASSDPLYVVDGIPVDDLTSLNPNDIESIEVLKDASSSAIYGSRGANGVVLVTTKKGKDGKLKVEFQGTWGLQSPEKKVDMLSAEEWIDYRTYWTNTNYVNVYGSKGATVNDDQATRQRITGSTGINPSYMLDPRWSEPNYGGLYFVDWQDEFFQTALMQNYQVAVSGSTSKTQYRASLGYLNQDGIVINTDYSRITMRANIDSQINKHIKAGLQIAPTVSWSNGGRVHGKDSQSHQMLSMVPVAEPDAGIYSAAEPYANYQWGGTTVSPVAYMERSSNQTDVVRLQTSAYVKADIIDGLSAELTGAWNFYSYQNRTYTPSSVHRYWNQGEGVQTDARRTDTHTNNLMVQAVINYNKTFGKHTIGAMIGSSLEETRSNRSYMRVSKLPNDAINYWDLAYAGTINNAEASIITPVRLLSYFGRVQYDYGDRYMVNASLRRDGSSKFGANAKWGYFPAVSGAWRISNEAFWPSDATVNSLKIRASWGMNGNNSIPSTAAISELGNANYPFGGTASAGFAAASAANPDLGWEKTKSWNVAFDLGLFDNRIYLSADYYVKKTTDLLYEVQVPSILGYTSQWSNIGSISNKGFELELSTQNLTGAFSWSTNFNLGWNKNKVDNLGLDGQSVYVGQSNVRTSQVLMEGEALNTFWLYKSIGVFKNQAELDGYPHISDAKVGGVKYEDVNKDGKITEEDRVYCGHPSPDFTFGVTNTFKWKNFDLSVLVTGQTGGKIYGLLGRAIDRPGMGANLNVLAKWKNMWRSEEEPGDGVVPSIFGSDSNSMYTDRWLYSSDFIKIKNLTFGYTFNAKKWGITYARVFLSAENLLMWDNYDYYSPESQSDNENGNNYDYGAYPMARTFSLGINLTF